MSCDSDNNISSTVDSEDENFVAPHSNWKVFKMTMKGVNKRYWYNEVTGKLFWVAPPPNVKYVSPAKRRKNIGTMDAFIARPPTGLASDPIGFKVFNDATPAISPPLRVAQVQQPVIPRAIDLTFPVTDKMILHGPDGLIAKAKALGVAHLSSGGSGGFLLKKQIMINITNHFKALHKQDSTNYHDSLCFKSPKQAIDRQRKLRPKPFLVAKKTPPDEVKHPKPRKHKSIPVAVYVLIKYKDRGFYQDRFGHVKFSCDNKPKGRMDVSNIESHLKTDKHAMYEMGRQERQAHNGRLTEAFDAEAGQRASDVMIHTRYFRGRFVEVLLSCGIPLYRADGVLRKFIEGVSEDSLDHSSNLKCDYIPKLLALEEQELERELRGKQFSIVFDATPRMGDVFALIVCFVSHDETKAVVKLRLIHMSFVRGSLNAHLQCGETQDGLQKLRMVHKDVTASSMDGCFTNIKIINYIDQHQDVKWMKVLCFSHCGNNGGQEAGFPVLDRFWSLLQKICGLSEKVKNIWEEETLISWKTFSENRWHSQYEVFHSIYLNFACIDRVAIRIFEEEVAPCNAASLLRMIQDSASLWSLKIELSALV
jgi:hypothetical protein